MTDEAIKANKEHKHSWEVTLDSKPLSENDYHLIFVECNCGIKISITDSSIYVHKEEIYLGCVFFTKEDTNA